MIAHYLNRLAGRPPAPSPIAPAEPIAAPAEVLPPPPDLRAFGILSMIEESLVLGRQWSTITLLPPRSRAVVHCERLADGAAIVRRCASRSYGAAPAMAGPLYRIYTAETAERTTTPPACERCGRVAAVLVDGRCIECIERAAAPRITGDPIASFNTVTDAFNSVEMRTLAHGPEPVVVVASRARIIRDAPSGSNTIEALSAMAQVAASRGVMLAILAGAAPEAPVELYRAAPDSPAEMLDWHRV